MVKESVKQKIQIRLKSYYDISQSIDNLPPQNREVARQRKIWITNNDVVAVLDEATKQIREKSESAEKIARFVESHKNYMQKVHGVKHARVTEEYVKLKEVLAILDGETKK